MGELKLWLKKEGLDRGDEDKTIKFENMKKIGKEDKDGVGKN